MVKNASAKTPRVISVEDLPSVMAGTKNVLATLSAAKGGEGSDRMADDEFGPSSSEFCTPATTTWGQIGRERPGPLSQKKKRGSPRNGTDRCAVGRGGVRLLSDVHIFQGLWPQEKKGSPPTTGEYVGLAAAREEAAKRERELMEARAERELVEMACDARVTRAKAGSPSISASARMTPLSKWMPEITSLRIRTRQSKGR